jgi:hypothetical protein
MTNRVSEFEGSQLDLIRSSASIFHWASKQEDHKNGSMFFIDTGAGLFGVTAKHVYESYLGDVAQKHVRCKIDGMQFDPIERFVSAGEMCDVATFRIAEEELRTLNRLTTPWPPVVPKLARWFSWLAFRGVKSAFLTRIP